jgi:hypothetical protein
VEVRLFALKVLQRGPTAHTANLGMKDSSASAAFSPVQRSSRSVPPRSLGAAWRTNRPAVARRASQKGDRSPGCGDAQRHHTPDVRFAPGPIPSHASSTRSGRWSVSPAGS